jgi:hypothetical protein
MHVHRLNLQLNEDLAAARAVYLDVPAYALCAFGALRSAEVVDKALTDAFPAECTPEQRLSFLGCNKDQPQVLAQVVVGFPTPDVLGLTLLLVRQGVQRRHLACEMLDRLSRQARRWPGIQRWRTFVLESNAAANAFFGHCGFMVATPPQVLRGFHEGARCLERPIKARPVCRGGHGQGISHAARVTVPDGRVRVW